MARKTMLHGMKINTRWSPATMFSSLFLIILGCGVAIPLALLFWAPISIVIEDVYLINIDFKGWELVYEGISQMIVGVNGGEEVFLENIQDYSGITKLFVILELIFANSSLSELSANFGFDIAPVFALITVGLLVLTVALVGITSLFAVLIGLYGLLTGRVRNFKIFKRTAWWLFIFLIFEAGIPIALYFLMPQLLNGFELVIEEILVTIESASIKFTSVIYQMVYLIGAFVIAIVINIIYTVRFKNALYIKNLKALEAAQAAREASGYPGFGTQKVNNYGVNTEQQKSVRPEIIYVPAPQPEVVQAKKTIDYSKMNGLPSNLTAIGGHSFSKNLNLEVAIIPSTITEIGASAFANCLNLQMVSIPLSVKKIGYNAFFGCKKLTRINYNGKKADWSKVKRGSNWLSSAGVTTVICLDGPVTVNPYH